MKATKRNTTRSKPATKRAARPLSDEVCNQFRQAVLHLWIEGGLSVKQVAIECRRWMKLPIRPNQVVAMLTLELERINTAEAACWAAWEASKATGPGDPAHMVGLLACFDRRIELLRLY